MGKDLKGKELGKGLSQRKDGRYEARYTDNFGKRHSFYDEKLSVVRKKLNEALYSKEHNIHFCECKLTLNEWFDVWTETFYKSTVKPNTYLATLARFDLRIRNSALGNMRITDIKNVHIQKFVNDLVDKNLLSTTINIYCGTIKMVLDKAIDCEYITVNPATKIVLPKKNDSFKEALSRREQELFLQHSQNSSYYNLFQFALLTGMRIGEMLALTWDDVDFSQRTITVNKTVASVVKNKKDFFRLQGFKVVENQSEVIMSPKTQTSIRIIPMSNKCYDLLSEMWRTHSDSVNIIFHSRKNSYLKNANIHKSIKKICQKIRETGEPMKDISAHSFRHTFATRCIEMNVNVKTVQYLLGHSNIATTMNIYTHISAEQAKRELQAIDTLNV